jgi:large repetitive protein
VQPVTSSSSITTSLGYDQAGNQTAVNGGNGNTTWTTYNSWNQPEAVIEPATAAAPAATGRTWTTSYDKDGRQASVSQPGGILVSYGYNPLGELNAQSGSGTPAATPALSFGYDLDGRMTSATTPAGTDTFTPNANGQLTAASGPSGNSGVGYNNDGLVSSETSPAGAASYTYDSADRLATVADPLTGATLTYGYNANSQPSAIAYSSGGASGPTQKFGYDALNRLASDALTSASGAAIASQSYGYDNNDNLTSQTTTGMAGAGSVSYGYDQANRLGSSTSGGTTTSYSYDNDGNLTAAGATTYNYNAQDQVTSQVTSAGTTSYGYTLSGTLASVTPPSGTAQSYTSNAYGQTVTAPGGIGYGYDALGRLTTRTTSSATSSLSWLGSGSTLTSEGTSNYSYTPGGSLVAATAGGAASGVMSNVHGDVTGLFSPATGTSALTASAAYSPYGAVPASSGTMPSAGYQGDYTDPSTGQVDMNARWYSPSTGTFTSNDTITGSPAATLTGQNPYGYAGATRSPPPTPPDTAGRHGRARSASGLPPVPRWVRQPVPRWGSRALRSPRRGGLAAWEVGRQLASLGQQQLSRVLFVSVFRCDREPLTAHRGPPGESGCDVSGQWRRPGGVHRQLLGRAPAAPAAAAGHLRRGSAGPGRAVLAAPRPLHHSRRPGRDQPGMAVPPRPWHRRTGPQATRHS